MARLSPVIFWQQSGEFLAAAERELSVRKGAVSIPAYFLMGRALELVLKSFLLLSGQTEEDLKAVGHDLLDALAEAQAKGLARAADLQPEDVVAIRMLNPYYVTKNLEYVSTGYKRLPESRNLLAAANRLLDGLAPDIRKWRPSE